VARRRSKGEGSIWKEGNSWRVAISIDGRRISKSFKTRGDCRDWLRKMQNKVDQGLTFKGSRLTFTEYLQDWLVVHESQLSPKTAQRYAQICRDYIIPSIGNIKLSDMTMEHIEKFYRDMLIQGESARNIRWIHSVLHRSLNDAVKRGAIGFNAAHGVRLPKLPHREMDILNENEVQQFLIAAQGNRHEALFHIAVKTGIRQGELLGLKWKDLNWDLGTVIVQRQVQRVKGHGMVFMPPKTKSGRRTIKLGEDALHVLREHLAKQRINQQVAGERWQDMGLIFPSQVGTPQSTSNLLKEYKQLLKQVGLRGIRFHDLRHTAASLMLNHGVPALVVSKILGHSKPSTTLDIYGHVIPVMQDSVASLMDDLLTPIPVKMGEPVDIESLSEGS